MTLDHLRQILKNATQPDMKQRIETDIKAYIVQSFWETHPHIIVGNYPILKAYESIPNKDTKPLTQILDLIHDQIISQNLQEEVIL